jgi:hypothetical protein
MHGDEVARPDELVELTVADLTVRIALRSVENDEEVVVVGVDLRHVAGLAAIADGERMELEYLGEDPFGRPV